MTRGLTGLIMTFVLLCPPQLQASSTEAFKKDLIKWIEVLGDAMGETYSFDAKKADQKLAEVEKSADAITCKDRSIPNAKKEDACFAFASNAFGLTLRAGRPKEAEEALRKAAEDGAAWLKQLPPARKKFAQDILTELVKANEEEMKRVQELIQKSQLELNNACSKSARSYADWAQCIVNDVAVAFANRLGGDAFGEGFLDQLTYLPALGMLGLQVAIRFAAEEMALTAKVKDYSGP